MSFSSSSRRKSRDQTSSSSLNQSSVKNIWELIEEEIVLSKTNQNNTNKTQTETPTPETQDGQGQLDTSKQQLKVPKVIAFRAEGTNSFLMVLGDSGCGKTTIIQQFLNPSKSVDKMKPTVALDYTFGRRTSASGDRKDITHVWELGGGLKLRELVPVVSTKERLARMSFIITVDLSKPAAAWSTVNRYVKVVNDAVVKCIAEIPNKRERDTVKRELAARVNAHRYSRRMKKADSNQENEDKEPEQDDNHCEPDGDAAQEAKKMSSSVCKVPLVIVGTKYDKLRDEDSVKRKLLAQAMRYLALATGAALVYVSRKDKPSLSAIRATLNHHAFDTELRKVTQLDAAMPLFVLAGKDTLSSIGMPPGGHRGDFEDESMPMLSSRRVATWERALAEYYPTGEYPPKNKDSETKNNMNGESKDGGEGGEEEGQEGKEHELDDLKLSPEGVVDAMRAQKDIELQQYRNKAARDLRVQAQQKLH